MLFPEISLRSSSASNSILIPDRNAKVYFSGSKQNFQRYLGTSCSSHMELDNLTNIYQNSNLTRNSENRISLHEEKQFFPKKIMIKKSEKNFPKDFFENMLPSKYINTTHQKTESEAQDNTQMSVNYPKNNSHLTKKRHYDINPNAISYECLLREKNFNDNLSNLISNRYGKFSKITEISYDSNSYPQKILTDNSIKKIQKYEKTDLFKDFFLKNEITLETAETLESSIKKAIVKRKINPKLVSKIHPLKPIILEKSQSTSTQENSKNENENEFIENQENDKKLSEFQSNIYQNDNQQGGKHGNKNWGAMFTFYNNDLKNSSEEHNQNENTTFSKEIVDETINRKTGNFKIISKIIDK